jgi:hypothetical protein
MEQMKDSENYNLVIPAKLKHHVENLIPESFTKRHAQNIYLRGWSEFWISNAQSNINEVIGAVKDTIKDDLKDMDYSFLSFIYPYVLGIDREFAFNCLVWSSANGNIWGDTWSRPLKDSREIWGKAIKDFPGRIKEYFDKSVFNTGRYYGSEGYYFVPIPKITQFYIDQGKLEQAEKITEYCLSSLPTLFPDTKLPVPKFFDLEQEIDEFDILIKRFEWLSPLVRERAGFHLAQLLENDQSGQIHNRLLKWFKQVKLESIACCGLLVVLKSLRKSTGASYKHIDVNELEKNISARCIGTDLLLMAISDQLKQTLAVSNPLIISLPRTEINITEDIFLKKVGGYLQNVYLDNIRDLQNMSGWKVWRIWYTLFKLRCEELNVNERTDDLSYGHHQNYIIGYSPLISEILKSTYFGTLGYLHYSQKIGYEDAFHYTVKSFPVDISIWDIKVSSVPEWWCQFKSTNDSSRGDLSITELDRPVSELIDLHPVKKLLYMHGTVRSHKNHYQNTLQATICLIPFGYKVKGSNLPSDEEIYDLLERKSGTWYSKVSDITKFNFFENPLVYSDKESLKLQLNDLELIPLVSSIRQLSTQMWQYFRIFSPPYLLTPILSSGLKLKLDEQLIKYEQNGEVVSQMFDFELGIRDVSTFGEDVPCGTYLTINKKYVEEFLQRNKVRLGHVYKIKYKTRDSFHSKDFKELEVYKTINLSPLII